MRVFQNTLFAIGLLGSLLTTSSANDIFLDVVQGDTEDVRNQIEDSPGLVQIRDQLGATLLHHAARLKNPDMTRMLIKAGADINARSYAGFTPLDAALRSKADTSAAALKEAGATPSAAPISGLSGNPRGRTDDELNGVMLDVEQLLSVGRGPEAFEMLSPYYRDHADDPDVAALFGHAAYARGKYAHAVMAFQSVVEHYPGNNRIRLELARAYQATGQEVDAGREYEAVLSQNPPPAIANRIRKAREAGRSQPERITWSGRLEVGGFYDDNVNFGPASDQIAITPITFFDTITIDRFDVAEEGQPQEDGGGHIAGSIYGFTDPGAPGGWYAFGGANGYRSWLGDDENFESGAAGATLGIQHNGQRASWSFPLHATHLQLGNDPLVNLYTFEPTLGFQWFENWHVVAALTTEYRDYDEIDTRDGTYLGYRETLTWAPEDSPLSLSLMGKVYNEGAEEKAFEAFGWSVGLSGRYTMAGSIQAYANWSFSNEDFDKQEELAPEGREDDIQEASIGITTSFGENYGIDLNVLYTDNESTFDLYTYDRTRTTLSFFRLF